MTEAQLTRRELKILRNRWPSAFIWKINDRITAGVPDAVLVNGAATTKTVWIEFKRALRMNIDPWTLVTPLQKQTMQRLANNGQAVVLVTFWPNKALSIHWKLRDHLCADTLPAKHVNLISFFAEECGWSWS